MLSNGQQYKWNIISMSYENNHNKSTNHLWLCIFSLKTQFDTIKSNVHENDVTTRYFIWENFVFYVHFVHLVRCFLLNDFFLFCFFGNKVFVSRTTDVALFFFFFFFEIIIIIVALLFWLILLSSSDLNGKNRNLKWFNTLS